MTTSPLKGKAAIWMKVCELLNSNMAVTSLCCPLYSAEHALYFIEYVTSVTVIGVIWGPSMHNFHNNSDATHHIALECEYLTCFTKLQDGKTTNAVKQRFCRHHL